MPVSQMEQAYKVEMMQLNPKYTSNIERESRRDSIDFFWRSLHISTRVALSKRMREFT
jgi:hypothetical protein